jgi:hypothetical protein
VGVSLGVASHVLAKLLVPGVARWGSRQWAKHNWDKGYGAGGPKAEGLKRIQQDIRRHKNELRIPMEARYLHERGVLVLGVEARRCDCGEAGKWLQGRSLLSPHKHGYIKTSVPQCFEGCTRV